MTTPNDPLYSSQWHLRLLGNIERIWDDYTGQDVHVGVYDDGLQFTHPDLNDNYDASLHFRQGGRVFVPTPITLTGRDPDAHGTSVAGIIAAEAGNGIGGVGVAYGASLTGINVLSDPRLQGESISLAAFRHAANFDVMSNSWGYDSDFDQDLSLAEPGSTASLIRAAFHSAVAHGREGLGTVIVLAAGNEATNASGSGINTMREVISVAALTPGGSAESYTNFGSNILIAAGAAAVTTDLMGSAGYNAQAGNPGNYQDDFNGTSAATPVVSGVVALMLEANPDLGWRDVQEILASSARLTGSIVGGSDAQEVQGTQFQQLDRHVGANLVRTGDSWNDGGRAISLDYGFGRADAYAAVRLAEVWSLIHPTAQTAANEAHLHSESLAARTMVYGGQGGAVRVALTQTAHLDIDHVAVSFSFSYSNPTQSTDGLRFYLVDPNGTTFDLMVGADIRYGELHNGFRWTFGISQAMGLDAAGTWTLYVKDEDADGPLASANVIRDVSLDFYGSAAHSNSIHHITADYLRVTAADAGGLRDRVIQDADGGTDWLQMATLAGNVVANLTAGQEFRVGGVVWGRIGGTTAIENLVTGDGHDRLTGNALGNILSGMRGNDTLSGAGGGDRLLGGEGRDRISGGDGRDVLMGGEGDDLCWGDAEDDALFGDAGADALHGATGADSLTGGAGADSLEGGYGADRLCGNEGSDLLDGGAGADRFLFLDHSGGDRVVGFADDIDTLGLDAALWGHTALTVVQVLNRYAHVSAGAVLFDFGGGDTLRIEGVAGLAALIDDITIL